MREMLRGALLALCLALIALCSVPGAARAAEPVTIASGGIEASVEPDPFRIAFRDRASGQVLRTLAGGPPPTLGDLHARYGAPGYSFDLRIPILNNAYLGYYVGLNVETLWFHGTRVLGASRSGGDLVLDVATNDPLGHRLSVRLSPNREGAITVDSRIAPGSGPLAGLASVSGTAFEAEAGERFLGFGERSNAADQTGNEVFSWAEEGPFSSGVGEPLLRPLLPDFTFPTGPTATNFPIPWAVSTRGFGVLIDQTQRSTMRMVSERADAWQAEAEAGHFRFTVFAGPTPADVVRRYSGYAGRQPDPGRWIFGPWFQPTGESRPYELADRFRAEDVPATVVQTYTHYLPCGAQVGRRDAERARTAAYHARGYKVTTYFNPHICASYSPVWGQAAADGHLVKNALGIPYLVTNPFTADGLVSEIDFTNPGGRALYARQLDEAIDDGFDGWMEDFGEYTPTDSVFANGKNGLEMHNRYPVEYHCASYAHTRGRMGRDAAVFVRSGFHGVQPCARIVWGGDPTEDWSCADGLCAALHQMLSTGLSGVAYWGSDIGGFHALVNPRTSDELNTRWLQLGAVSGVMRTQANGYSLLPNRDSRSQVWSPAVLPVWREYAKLRTQLLPYIEAASEAYQETGMPLSRHLALAYPNDPAAAARQDELMFGPDLLAAPVVSEGERERSVYLPGGEWIDLWQTLDFDPANGAFFHTRPPRLIAGGREVSVPAPLDRLPLLARAGTILPLLPDDVDTLAPEGSGEGLVKLGERDGTRNLLVFPRGASRADLAGDETIASTELAAETVATTRRACARKRKGKRAKGKRIKCKRVKGKRIKRKRKRRKVTTTKQLPDRWSLRVSGSPGRLFNVNATMSTLERPFVPCGVELDGRPLTPSAWSYDASTSVLRASFKGREATLTASRTCDPQMQKAKKKKKKKRRKRGRR